MSEEQKTILVLAGKSYLESFDSLMSGSFGVLQALTEQEALESLSRRKIDVMFLDMELKGGQGGLDVLGRVKEILPDIPVIILTATPDVQTAIEAMRLGAFHYISKSPKFEEF